MAKPLHNLQRKHARSHWTPESQQAFNKLKELLTTAPVLGYPMDSRDLILNRDSSNFRIGAVLSQLQQGEESALAYGSRSLTPTELLYYSERAAGGGGLHSTVPSVPAGQIFHGVHRP